MKKTIIIFIIGVIIGSGSTLLYREIESKSRKSKELQIKMELQRKEEKLRKIKNYKLSGTSYTLGYLVEALCGIKGTSKWTTVSSDEIQNPNYFLMKCEINNIELRNQLVNVEIIFLCNKDIEVGQYKRISLGEETLTYNDFGFPETLDFPPTIMELLVTAGLKIYLKTGH